MTTTTLNRAIAAPNSGSPLLIAVFGLPVSLVALFVLAFDRGPDFLVFGTMAICFLALAAIFLLSSGGILSQWYVAPGFMTILASVEFVAVPFIRFVTGDDRIDSYYLRAMAYLILGFSVFWLACWMLKRPGGLTFVAERSGGDSRIVLSTVLLFGVGVLAQVVLWQLGAIGYEAAVQRYQADISAIGALHVATQALGMATLVSGIEVFGKHSKSPLMRVILVSSITLNLAFGVVSGMKIEVLMPIFTLALLIGVTQRRLPALVWALPVLFVVLQPFVNAYRANLNAGYAAQINTIGGLTDAMGKSFEDMMAGNQVSAASMQRSTFDRYGYRLSDLALFHSVLQLPSPDLLNGDETIWLAPFYPFIPRPLWKEKPVFNKGQRMSEALGLGRSTSTNVPGIADLYVLGGPLGIVIGMFVWGAVLQIFMNSVRGGMSERGTFLYVLILFSLTNIERDIVASIGGVVQAVCVLLIISKIIYGGPLFSMSSLPRRARV
jgi:hypothetical protein